MLDRTLPKTIGPYLVDGLIGRGGMGAVYRAHHRETRAPCALKVIHAGLLDGALAARSLARFQREAELLARLAGDHAIVRVHAAGVDLGRPWCAMDFVVGRSLAQVLRDGPLDVEEAVRIVGEVARALQRAHELGVIHRDIKPDNILIDERDAPRIVDFGIAFDVAADRLTRTGEMVGTPAYMAPEQCHRSSSAEDEIGPRTDVYALGALLFSCLTAEPPFTGTGAALLVAVVKSPARRPRSVRPEVPVALDAVCARAMTKDSRGRYPSAAAFADDLERWESGESVEALRGSGIGGARRVRAGIGALLALAAVTMLAGLLLVRTPPEADPETRAAVLGRVAETLRGGGTPSAGDLAIVDRIAAAPATPPDEALRARVLALVAEVGRAPRDPDTTTELAAALREDASPRRLATVAESLAAAGKVATLDAVFHRHDPVLALPPGAARAVAILLSSEESGVPPPRDAAAYRALYHASGLPREARGRLALRRIEADLGAGDLASDAALRRLDALAADLGASPQVRLSEERFVALVRDVETDLDAGEHDRATTTGLLLARVLEPPEVLPPSLVARLHIGLFASFGDTDALSAQSATMMSILLPLGLEPLELRGSDGLLALLGEDWWLAQGRAQRDEPPSLQRALGLAFGARLLASRDEHRIEVEAWAEEALAATPRRRRTLSLVASAYEKLKRYGEAVTLLEEAVKLDRSRPLDRRWARLPANLAGFVGRRDAVRAAALLEEAAMIQRENDPRLREALELGARAPFAWDARSPIANAARETARRLMTAERCCDGSPTADDLLELSAEFADADVEAVFVGIERATHRQLHGDHERAIELLDEVAPIAQRHLREDSERWQERLATILRARATSLVAIGLVEEAANDRVKAERLHPGGG